VWIVFKYHSLPARQKKYLTNNQKKFILLVLNNKPHHLHIIKQSYKNYRFEKLKSNKYTYFLQIQNKQ